MDEVGRMKQIRLFDMDTAPLDDDAREAIGIRSGRVGPICFGCTEASYDLAVEVFTALADPNDDAAGQTDG